MSTISFALYFLALIIVFKTIHGNGNDGQNSLVTLLELQMEHCNTFMLCTIKVEINGSLQSPPATCCKNCSCDKECVGMGTCCPDFGLNNTLGDIVITNKSDLFSHLNYLNTSYEQLLRTPYKATQRHIGCVEAKVVKNDIRYDFPSMLNYYWMVNTCPHHIRGNQDTVRRCSDDVHLLTSGNNTNEPDLFVPVTSLETNTTYKNVYCFRCNELGSSTENLRTWRVMYVCVSNMVLLFENPYRQLRNIASNDKFHACNVLFKPSQQIQDLVNRCDQEGVETCLEGSNKQLDEICKAYHLPVVNIENGISFRKYKNIACYMCNKKVNFQSDCTNMFMNNEELSVEMNLLVDKQHNTILQYDESDLHVLNVSMGRDGGICKTGFIPGSDMVTCKRVLCPRHFYPLEGSCIPAFTYTENIYFTVLMEVRRVQRVGQASRAIFHRKYSATVSSLAAALFERFTHGLWQMTNDYDVLVLSFSMPDKIMHTGMLTSLSKFLAQIAFLKINTISTAVDTVTMVSKDNTPVFFGGNLYTRGKTRVPLPPVQAYHSLGNLTKEMRISCSHLCYRIKLEPSEIYKDNTGIFLINNTGETVFITDVQQLSDERFVICIEDIFPNITDINASYLFGGSNARLKARYLELKATTIPASTITDIKSDTIAGVTKEVVIIVSLVFVVAIICLVKYLRYRSGRRARGNEADE